METKSLGDYLDNLVANYFENFRLKPEEIAAKDKKVSAKKVAAKKKSRTKKNTDSNIKDEE